jgi:hypothetical protein
MTDDTNNVGAAGAQDDVLIRWTGWLDDFIGGLSALPGETATDFCCAAADEWQRSVMDDPPAPESAAMLALLEAARALTQVAWSAAQDERITRGAADAALRAALEGVRYDAQGWIDNGPPSAEEIRDGVKAVGATFKQAQDALADRVAEDEAHDAYAREHPYGAILGYQDPEVEADIIFTQVSEFTEDEQNRYAEAHDRLRQLIDQDLFSYVSDSSDAFIVVVCDVLRDIQSQAFSLSNMDESHKRIRRIRSALIAFTSALHIHQDQTYYQVKHKFGDESDEHKAVRKLFNDIYSDCFGYRWLIELRHVMLHINMNAFAIAFTARPNAGAEGHPRHEPVLDVEVVGRHGQGIQADRAGGDGRGPQRADMIKVLIPAFGPLQDEIDAIMFPAAEVAEDVETVRDLIGRFNGRQGMYALQTGPGFTRRLRTPSFSPLDPRVFAFAEQYEPPAAS